MTARTPEEPGHRAGPSTNGKTAQSYIAGIGASGALLAGAVVTFVFLVGAVSFEVWPEASERDSGTETLGVAELSGPSASGAAASSSATLGETVARLASAVPTVEVPDSPKADSGVKGGGGDVDAGDTGSPATPAPVPVGTGDSNTADTPGGGSGSGGSNEQSDRPSVSRPDRGNGGSGSGGTTSTPPTVPSTPGSNEPSDRPSSGGGRG